VQATGTDTNLTREQGAEMLQYPDGVNETYGLVSIQFMIDAFNMIGLPCHQKWVTFDEAYTIMREHTGVINPIGMYHFMACRGVDHMDIGDLWIANSAPGYLGVYDTLNRSQFNSFGPVQLVYID